MHSWESALDGELDGDHEKKRDLFLVHDIEVEDDGLSAWSLYLGLKGVLQQLKVQLELLDKSVVEEVLCWSRSELQWNVHFLSVLCVNMQGFTV